MLCDYAYVMHWFMRMWAICFEGDIYLYDDLLWCEALIYMIMFYDAIDRRLYVCDS